MSRISECQDRGQQWTYTSLNEALHYRIIILRVHTTSHNPLEQGFTARNPSFKNLTIEQYHQATASLGGRWAEGPYMKDVIIDHINQLIRRPQPERERYGNMGRGRYRNRISQYPLLPQSQSQSQSQFGYPGPPGPPGPVKAETDELTPWISTTANLDWALWYITKLLSQSQPGRDHGHDHGRGHGLGFKHENVKLAVISISTDRRVNKELYVAPFLWSKPEDGRRKCDVDRERYNRARTNAIFAKEVLFYGRIFKESILADLTFTRENLPFPLPPPYYNPPEMHNPTFASSWIGRLRWDPRLLNYEMAQYNRMKVMSGRCIWVDQPVDPRLQAFKRTDVDHQRENQIRDDFKSQIRVRAENMKVDAGEQDGVPMKALVGELVDLSI